MRCCAMYLLMLEDSFLVHERQSLCFYILDEINLVLKRFEERNGLKGYSRQAFMYEKNKP